VRAGALSGRLIQLDEAPLSYLVHYEFASRESMETYLRDEAPRLRAKGSRRFTAAEVVYERRKGSIINPSV